MYRELAGRRAASDRDSCDAHLQLLYPEILPLWQGLRLAALMLSSAGLALGLSTKAHQSPGRHTAALF